jgi:hypothetical protein
MGRKNIGSVIHGANFRNDTQHTEQWSGKHGAKLFDYCRNSWVSAFFVFYYI